MSTREDWPVGSQAWFEYHCWESDLSSDAVVWHHSHQTVTIVSHDAADHDCLRPVTYDERSDDGQPCVYTVRFADGLEYTAFEDELLTDTADFERPDPT